MRTLLLKILLVILVLISLSRVVAQDESTVTSCYTKTDVGFVFIFSNVPDDWFNETGWYFVGNDATVDSEAHTLTVVGLQFDNDYSYAIVGPLVPGDNFTASTDLSPQCNSTVTPTPEPTSMPIPTDQPAQSLIVQSTGVTCTVKYPEVVVVCNR